MNKTFLLLFFGILISSCAGLQKVSDRPEHPSKRERVSFLDERDRTDSRAENQKGQKESYASSSEELEPMSTRRPETPKRMPHSSAKKISRTSAKRPVKSSSKKTPDVSFARQTVLEQARSYIGIPYEYGGCDREGVDCSGLIQQVFATQGVMLPRNSRDQSKYGKRIKAKDVLPGDLVFFSHKGRIHHLGLVTATGKDNVWVIHSTSSKGVIEQNITQSPYWLARLHSYRRVL